AHRLAHRLAAHRTALLVALLVARSAAAGHVAGGLAMVAAVVAMKPATAAFEEATALFATVVVATVRGRGRRRRYITRGQGRAQHQKRSVHEDSSVFRAQGRGGQWLGTSRPPVYLPLDLHRGTSPVPRRGPSCPDRDGLPYSVLLFRQPCR